MKTEKACIITPNYPDLRSIERGAFVERVVRTWQHLGITVDVIAPRKIATILRSMKGKKYRDVEIAGSEVHYPTYISVSNKNLLNIDLNEISRKQFLDAAKRGVSRVSIPDFYYGQFLLLGGLAAVNAGKKHNVPSFSSVGEFSLLNDLNKKEKMLAKKTVKSLDGIICVSEELMHDVIQLGADPNRVTFFSNTVDLNRFQPMPKIDCREKLNLPADDVIGIFVGHFIERKGPLRVLNAIKKLQDPRLKTVFIGRGNQTLEDESILHQGPIPNKDLPYWLNAADFFVLPTLNEGYCNAINEAMACGLPILSSDIKSIRNQIPPGAGVLVDPEDEAEISEGIRKLITNQDYAEKLGQTAYQLQQDRSKVSRAEKIIEWIKNL